MIEREPAPPQKEAANSVSPARILVVDDQPANIQVVGAALGKLGHEIVPACDGPSALKRLEHRPSDLILLDVLMPGMDGYAVVRRIRENPAWNDIPIIFLSAASDKDMIVRALESGGVDYITKPFNHAELLSRVRTHLDLKKTRERLRQLAEDKDELLGIMAHDCKNHLGGMQMTAQLLSARAAENGDTKLQRMAQNIEEASDRLLEFVKEFLANASADHQLQLAPVPVDLAALAARVARDYQRTAARKGISLSLGAAPANAQVQADAGGLEQVLGNLISNAIKFSTAPSTVTIQVERGDHDVICTIADQGPGFTEEDQRRLFRRYQRLSARPTGGEPSTGLGLSIVKKLCHAMGGIIECFSVPGEGTRFIIRFRPAPEPSPQ